METIQEALKTNREQLGRLEAHLKNVLISPDVEEAKRITETLEDGTEISYRVAPRFETPFHVVMEGEKIRHTILDNNGNPRQIVVFDGQNWTQYIPKKKRAWIRTGEQRRGGMHVHPLEFGMNAMGTGVADILRDGQVLSTAWERFPEGGEVVKVRVRHPQSGVWYFEFDPSTRFLPKTIGTYGSQEAAFAVLTFRTHQKVPGREAWFLKGADQFILHNNKTTHPVRPAEYYQQNSLAVEKIVPLESDPGEDAVFQVALPDGTAVSDVTSKRSYIKGGAKDLELQNSLAGQRKSTIRLALIALNLALLAIVLCVFAYRRLCPASPNCENES